MAKTADGSSSIPGSVEAVSQGKFFTISIYQDPSYIEGIVQQSSRGLITDSSDTDNAQNTQSSKEDGGLHGDIGAKVNLPGIGGFNASAGGSSSDGVSNENLFGQQRTRNFKYTSAYYLHHVRQDLRAAGLLRKVVSAEDLKSLEVGDFVEFQAKFSPDEILSLMDVFNPDLVASLTRWVRKNKIISSITSAETNEQQQQALVLEFQTRPDADAEAAKAIAEAVRVDFRSGATRQYYGAIGPDSGITAVVVCDTRSFLVEDADRILDGNFTVLGKVSTPPASDVPILARNKVLDRIQPKAVDFLAENMRKMAKERINSNVAEIQTMEQYLDLNFPSRIAGISFNVIPIAIYI